MKRDWPSVSHVVLSICLAIGGGAAAWGATRSQVTETVAKTEVLSEKVQKLEVEVAVKEEAYKNILDKLNAIDAHLDKIDKRLEEK